MIYDVIIIGAGIMGSAAAFYLTESGQSCLLIDQFSLLHTYGSSHGESRIIRKSYNEKHFSSLMHESYKLWSALEKHYHEKFIITTGGLDFGLESSLDMKKIDKTVQEQQLKHEVLTHHEIMDRFPAFNVSANMYGIYQAEAGIVLASHALNFFHNAAQNNGLKVLTGEKILAVTEDSDSVLVSTQSKSFKGEKVIICAGSWINDFFKHFHSTHRTKILPVNFGYWKIKQNTQFKPGNFPIFIAWGEKPFYGLPSLEKDSYFKVGAHYSYEENEYRELDLNKRADPRVIKDLQELVGKTFPNACKDDYTVDSCNYTMNDYENFILDFHPDNSNIIFGGGFSGHGFKFAPLIGTILTDLALTGKTSYDISKFTLKNF